MANFEFYLFRFSDHNAERQARTGTGGAASQATLSIMALNHAAQLSLHLSKESRHELKLTTQTPERALVRNGQALP